MANERDGGGFGWGLVVGGLLGFVAGAYLASGPGKDQMEGLRSRTIELSSGAAQRARGAMNPERPLGRAIQEGMTAARRKRVELETEAEAEAPVEAQVQPRVPRTRITPAEES